MCEEIPEAVSPEGLRARAGMMRERGDESCARHLELAAEKIIKLSAPPKAPGTRLLIELLEKFAAEHEPGNLQRAALLDAIDTLRAAARQPPKTSLEDLDLQANSYSTATKDEEKKLRFTLYKSPGQKDPLGYMILTCEEIYDVGMHLIKNYDRLENL